MLSLICYNTKCHPARGNPMALTNTNRTAQRYRITLDITVEDDFNPYQIDWRKVLDLHADEYVENVTEDLSTSVSDYY